MQFDYKEGKKIEFEKMINKKYKWMINQTIPKLYHLNMKNVKIASANSFKEDWSFI